MNWPPSGGSLACSPVNEHFLDAVRSLRTYRGVAAAYRSHAARPGCTSRPVKPCSLGAQFIFATPQWLLADPMYLCAAGHSLDPLRKAANIFWTGI